MPHRGARGSSSKFFESSSSSSEEYSSEGDETPSDSDNDTSSSSNHGDSDVARLRGIGREGILRDIAVPSRTQPNVIQHSRQSASTATTFEAEQCSLDLTITNRNSISKDDHNSSSKPLPRKLQKYRTQIIRAISAVHDLLATQGRVGWVECEKAVGGVEMGFVEGLMEGSGGGEVVGTTAKGKGKGKGRGVSGVGGGGRIDSRDWTAFVYLTSLLTQLQLLYKNDKPLRARLTKLEAKAQIYLFGRVDTLRLRSSEKNVWKGAEEVLAQGIPIANHWMSRDIVLGMIIFLLDPSLTTLTIAPYNQIIPGQDQDQADGCCDLSRFPCDGWMRFLLLGRTFYDDADGESEKEVVRAEWGRARKLCLRGLGIGHLPERLLRLLPNLECLDIQQNPGITLPSCLTRSNPLLKHVHSRGSGVNVEVEDGYNTNHQYRMTDTSSSFGKPGNGVESLLAIVVRKVQVLEEEEVESEGREHPVDVLSYSSSTEDADREVDDQLGGGLVKYSYSCGVCGIFVLSTGLLQGGRSPFFVPGVRKWKFRIRDSERMWRVDVVGRVCTSCKDGLMLCHGVI